jgi:hypothetical protein
VLPLTEKVNELHIDVPDAVVCAELLQPLGAPILWDHRRRISSPSCDVSTL